MKKKKKKQKYGSIHTKSIIYPMQASGLCGGYLNIALYVLGIEPWQAVLTGFHRREKFGKKKKENKMIKSCSNTLLSSLNREDTKRALNSRKKRRENFYKMNLSLSCLV